MPPTGQPATLWLRASQIPLARRWADCAGLAVVRAGGPEPGQSARIAAAFDAEPIDDLRVALATGGPEAVVLWDASGLGAGSTWEFQEHVLTGARQRGARVLSFEPIPASLLELSAAVSQARRAPVGETDPEDQAAGVVPGLVCPALLGRLHPAVSDWAAAAAESGSVRSMVVECAGRSETGSLGMRLWDAMDLVSLMMGEPDAVHATYTGVHPASALHALPGESLRGLQGDLTAGLRFADGRGAVVLATDQAQTEHWRLTAVGPSGVIRLELGGLSAGEPEHALAQAAGRLARGDLAPIKGLDVSRVLSMAQAALLSARTGEPESPDLVRRMAGG